MAPESASILVLGTADWNQPIATNQHYVVRELCRNSFADVNFVESMGLRAPQLSQRDIARILNRLTSRVRKTRPQAKVQRPRPDGLKVLSPLTLPWHRGFTNPINRALLRRLVRPWLASTDKKLLWTYTPLTYGLESEANACVYHCVDLLREVPGIDAATIDFHERRLAASGAKAIATSQAVAQHLTRQGFRDVIVWENVADIDVIDRANPASAVRYPRRAIFAGNLSPLKIDYELIRGLAQAGIEVVLAGPRAEGGGRDSAQFNSLIESGVVYLGMLSLEELAAEMVRASVGLIPYVINDYTRGVSPLKTFEYLAAGLPIVSTHLPGVSPLEGAVFVEDTRSAFIERVVSVSNSFEPADINGRTTIAAAHSWRGRGEAIREYVAKMTASLSPDLP